MIHCKPILVIVIFTGMRQGHHTWGEGGRLHSSVAKPSKLWVIFTGLGRHTYGDEVVGGVHPPCPLPPNIQALPSTNTIF